MSQYATAVDAVLDLQESICRHAIFSQGKPWRDLSTHDRFAAVALAVRDRMVERMLATEEEYRRQDAKRLYYLSIEFLIGQSLGSNLRNLGIYESCRQALRHLGTDLQEVEESEPDAALGNGGLGRLAACFLDSLATLGMPGYGYGINYEYGLFKQEIDNGYQRELADNWLTQGSPWQIARPDEACMVPIYGRIEHGIDRHGVYNPMWMDWKVLIGMPCDMLIPGYGGGTVHFLRLYSARSSRDFDMRIFNDGDYFKAVEQKIQSEIVSKVLYPSDAVIANKELRLVQEYFLVACAVRDIVRRFQRNHSTFREFSSKVAIQLNDTHPALAVVELMRILVDEKELSWDDAWEVTQKTFGYTNHTLSSEALEKWPTALLEYVLPRHLPDYRVSLAEKIIPASDLSEQISTAGTEASGTGSMKMALNGAVTIGTFDGANIEILEEVGHENIFLFGLKAAELQAMRQQKSYCPQDYYDRYPRLKRVTDTFLSHLFCPQEPDLFAWIFRSLLDESDEHFHLADLPAYLAAQEEVAETFRDRDRWAHMAILNVARIGRFSSDRTVTQYANDIWGIRSYQASGQVLEKCGGGSARY